MADEKDPREAAAERGEDPGPEPAETSGAAHDGNVKQFPGNGGNGAPLADRTDDGEPEDDEQDQLELFVIEDGQKVSIGQLAKRGTPIEVRYALTGKSLPNTDGGILDPFATSHLMVADCVVDHTKPQYIRDGQQRVEKVILYVSLKPRIVQQALSARGLEMIETAKETKAAAEAA